MKRKMALNIGKGVAWGALAAGASWLVYSHFLVDHDMALPPPLGAEIKHWTDSEAGTVYYYQDTRGKGRPLVLVHSINAAASAYEMQPIFNHYRGNRPVYALDLPGFGFSERDDRHYSSQLYVNIIIAFLERIGGSAADVVALSLGAEFAGTVAADRPELIHSLVLISPTGLSQRRNQPRPQQAQENDQSDGLLRFFRFPLWSQPLYDLLVTRPVLRWFLQQSFAGPVDEELVEYDYRAAHRPGARFAPFYFISGKLFSPRIQQEAYTRIERPVLVIYDQDPNITFDTLPDLLLNHPNWQAVRIPPTCGLPHFEQMPAMAQALNDFWRV
jgi:pimeloyl-ACP methyl ester carboxylesterase